MFMDSATSPSAPRRMTGQRHTAKDESFQTRESNQKEICAMSIDFGLMLYASAFLLTLGKLIFKRFVSLRKNQGSSFCAVWSCTF